MLCGIYSRAYNLDLPLPYQCKLNCFLKYQVPLHYVRNKLHWDQSPWYNSMTCNSTANSKTILKYSILSSPTFHAKSSLILHVTIGMRKCCCSYSSNLSGTSLSYHMFSVSVHEPVSLKSSLSWGNECLSWSRNSPPFMQLERFTAVLQQSANGLHTAIFEFGSNLHIQYLRFILI
jgi:hypothetical protein